MEQDERRRPITTRGDNRQAGHLGTTCEHKENCNNGSGAFWMCYPHDWNLASFTKESAHAFSMGACAIVTRLLTDCLCCDPVLS